MQHPHIHIHPQRGGIGSQLHFFIFFIFFLLFCIAGTLGKNQLPAQENNKQHKPSSLFTSTLRVTGQISGEVTSKPFDTTEKC